MDIEKELIKILRETDEKTGIAERLRDFIRETYGPDCREYAGLDRCVRELTEFRRVIAEAGGEESTGRGKDVPERNIEDMTAIYIRECCLGNASAAISAFCRECGELIDREVI